MPQDDMESLPDGYSVNIHWSDVDGNPVRQCDVVCKGKNVLEGFPSPSAAVAAAKFHKQHAPVYTPTSIELCDQIIRNSLCRAVQGMSRTDRLRDAAAAVQLRESAGLVACTAVELEKAEQNE